MWWRETPVTSRSTVAVKLWSCTSSLTVVLFAQPWLDWLDVVRHCVKASKNWPRSQTWQFHCIKRCAGGGGQRPYLRLRSAAVISQCTCLHPAQQGVHTVCVCVSMLNSYSGPHKYLHSQQHFIWKKKMPDGLIALLCVFLSNAVKIIIYRKKTLNMPTRPCEIIDVFTCFSRRLMGLLMIAVDHLENVRLLWQSASLLQLMTPLIERSSW